MTTDTTEQRQLLWELIKDTRFAMFTTRHSNGHLHSRPMTTQNSKVDEDDSLWFFMSNRATRSPTSKPIRRSTSPTRTRARTSTSPSPAPPRSSTTTRRSASSGTSCPRPGFPGGPTDPDLALVQVRITHANYWDVKESKIVQLYEMAKAAMTGKPPTDLGRHGEVRMN